MVAEKGRGATLNVISHRFNMAEQVADGDWLDAVDVIDGPAPRRRTQVTVEHPRTIISRNTSPDLSFTQSINAYRGCEQPYTVAQRKRQSRPVYLSLGWSLSVIVVSGNL